MRSGGSLRVLLQYNCIPHYRARIFTLLSALQDVEFTIVADNDSDTPFLKTITTDGANPIRHIQARNYIFRLSGLPELYWQPSAIRLFLKKKPEVLIALGTPYSFTAWALLIIGRARKVPVLLWGHGLLGDESGPKWWLRRLLFRLASGQLLYGDRAKELLIGKGFDPATLHVVYNSLDYDSQLEVVDGLSASDVAGYRAELGVDDGQRLVVFTGRLQVVKRLDMLVKAAGLLKRRGHVVHLAFIGEGSERDSLEQLAEEWGVAPYLHFLGVSYDERFLGTVLSAADLSVIPSGAGLSVIHSLVFGTPVLLNDRIECHGPEWEAVEEGETGFFYKYGDLDDLAKKMEAALYPVPKKQGMEEACRRIVRERYNPHIQVDIFVDAVRQATFSTPG